MVGIETLARAADIAFLMFKIVGSLTACFFCIYVIYRVLCSGFNVMIKVHSPQYIYEEDEEDNTSSEEDKDSSYKSS